MLEETVTCVARPSTAANIA
jgi:ubiquitin-protein ligase